MARSSFVVAALALLVLLVQTVVAQVSSGAYRIVSVAEGTTVRPQEPGSPFYVPAGGSSSPPGSIPDVFELRRLTNGDYQFKSRTYSLYARSGGTFVTLNQQGSAFRLEAVGGGVYRIQSRDSNLAWTVRIGNAKSVIALQPAGSGDLQHFRFVRAPPA
ncbi:hypothetical protein BGZ68_010217 [Mortierella alpina]|nr:hypothetical protein BGZ68_010217 [Mortierella alpina]